MPEEPQSNGQIRDLAPSRAPAYGGREGRILLTAFEPFGGSSVNASLETATLLAGSDPSIDLVVLPVVRGDAGRIALACLKERREAGAPPTLIVSLGEAGPEMVVRLEKVAINWDHYRIPDNAGNQPQDTLILPDGPDAYFATLPVAEAVHRLSALTPVPITVSLSAGAFLCNHIAYVLLNHLQDRPVCPYAFVHIPSWRPEQGEEALENIVVTLRHLLNYWRESLHHDSSR